jgi:hypothetical protein
VDRAIRYREQIKHRDNLPDDGETSAALMSARMFETMEPRPT